MDSMSMDMDAMTMTMVMSATTTSATAMATSSAASMSGGKGGMGGGDCKISMLWNWYTIDACFISRQWHITSEGAFAASCIGVVFLVIALEGLRRLAKEYDAYLVRRHRASTPAVATAIVDKSGASADDRGSGPAVPPVCNDVRGTYRPTFLQQAVRALFHMLQFAVAYFIMLLAMYYNGYIILSIFFGAYLGSFLFHWENMELRNTSAGDEATVCCG